MLPFYFFALLVHAAFSLDVPCKDGVEISSRPVKIAEELVGNWTYIYHWDSETEFSSEFIEDPSDPVLSCPYIEISPASPDFVKEKKEACSSDSVPFSWEDAKLKFNAPLMKIEDSIIFVGEKENWILVDCKTMARVEGKKVSDDVFVLVNPDEPKVSEMLSRKPVRTSDLRCLVQNVDVGKGVNGIGLCY